MSFLNPILLAGLAAIAVPIIIHLLNRRKFHKVVWAAMRFLQTSVEQNQRRMRVEDMILLALRCLLVALLAVALARPAILSKATDLFGQSKVTGVLILDNSYSMGVSDGSMTRFDKARDAALAAIDSLPIGSATAVLLASDVVRGAIPEPTFDMNLARKVIRDAPLTDRGTDLLPAIEKAVDVLRDRLAIRKEIYLITDGQAVGWSQLSEIQSAFEKTKSEITTHIILTSEHEDQNLGVSDLRLASGLSPVKQSLRFEVKVTNFGKEEARSIRVGLNVDDEAATDEFTIDALPPGSTKSISLFGKLMTEGFHSVHARIPGDRLRADDQRSLVVRAIKDVRVLLVDGEPGSEPRDSETYFLRNALIPVPSEMQGDYFIKATTVTTPDLGSVRVDDFDALILANVSDVSENMLRNVEQYLRRGGGLIVFPGAKANPIFYNEQLFRRFQFLPAGLGTPRGEADQDEKYFTLQDKDYQHSIVAIWNDPASGTLGSARFYRAFQMLPSTLPKSKDAGEPQVILKFADGAPAVMERTWGLGRVVLFSSTADTAWNDLPVRLSFVPLVHRTLGSIVQRQDEGLNIRVGEKFARRVGAEFLDRSATFTKPGQTEAFREVDRVEVVDGRPMLQYDLTDFAGVYEAAILDPPLTIKFAAQANAAESSMDELSPAQLNTIRSAAQVLQWSPSVDLKGVVQKDRTGLEFWLPIAILALVVAGAETFLAQLFSREK
ncbi:MAG TPA: BatA domain-containing protein [Verrucomicrobiae bacterium]|nr:BatA domain-containing protein [Verrucomicrobiae bacterium]